MNHRLLKVLKGVNRTLGPVLPPTLLSRTVDGIPGLVHFDDLMLRGDDPDGARHYLENGLSAMRHIEGALRAGNMGWSDVHSFLDFPSGYGRVSRHLVQRVRPTCVTACDIDHAATRFCAAAFGVTPLQSRRDPRRITFPTTYEVAFVGSLLTHLPIEGVFGVLDTLVGVIRPGGVLVFSTQGESCLQHLDWYGEHFANHAGTFRAEVRNLGHCFVPYQRQRDYGIAIHSARFLTESIQARYGSQIELTRYEERGWDRHQDVWSYRLRAHE